MHDGHHHHHGSHGRHDHDDGVTHPHAVPGHNRPREAAQWQVPHKPEGTETPPPLRDLDLVEASFVEGFAGASDPTSFLRLAGIPFVGMDGSGRRLHLLRVELEAMTDVGSVVPLLGGHGFHYDPLPSRLTSRRRRLAFIYHDGQASVRLDFAAARNLESHSDASPLGPGSIE
jgi:hypothetical protein